MPRWLKLESSTLGRAVEQEAIEALPLANRNYTQILGLSPGVVAALPDATALGRGLAKCYLQRRQDHLEQHPIQRHRRE